MRHAVHIDAQVQHVAVMVTPDEQVVGVGAEIGRRRVEQAPAGLTALAGGPADVDFPVSAEQPLVLVHEQCLRGLVGVLVVHADRHSCAVHPHQHAGLRAHDLAHQGTQRGRHGRQAHAGARQQVKLASPLQLLADLWHGKGCRRRACRKGCTR